MSPKMIWGIATLIILLVGVISFVMLTRTTEPGIIVNDVPEETLDNIRKENNRQILSTQKPPDEPGFVWEWHGDHWHKVKEDTPSEQVNATPLNTEEYGITRQGKRYKINPAWADTPAATATPTGPPLTIAWQDGGGPPSGSSINWRDPLVWESYRNFWGFEPPFRDEYTPRIDNWGTPLQNFSGTYIVFHYKKRIGFRPSPDQLAEYNQLQSQLQTARVSGDTLRADRLRQDMLLLRESARGELPITHTFEALGYGPEGFLDDPEKEKAATEASIRDVYKRMGIEHLYEFYEKN